MQDSSEIPGDKRERQRSVGSSNIRDQSHLCNISLATKEEIKSSKAYLRGVPGEIRLQAAALPKISMLKMPQGINRPAGTELAGTMGVSAVTNTGQRTRRSPPYLITVGEVFLGFQMTFGARG